MPPKKPADIAPLSDETLSDVEEETVRKPQKKPAKAEKRNKEGSKDPEVALKNAVDQMLDGSDGEDDGSNLFALSIPPKPDFLVKPNKKDRLMILNVEVDNFKSYYGKASIGPFHKSFTSIIGPNGSGKSNLIDSLLFVFGFRASKIRSAKVSTLIHKSAGRAPDSCTVTIHFQRIVDVPGHYEVVKDSRFEISRTAYKNSSSSYAINGRAASKNEVEARLRLVDIDIEHNRFLILQGEVEQIATMKPVGATKSETGIVEYLEDIIGSNRLEPFVKLFQRRVNKLTCDLSQQRISRDHARNSKIAMEGPVRTAIEFLSKENETKTIQMKLDQRIRQKHLDKVAPKQEELDKKIENMNTAAVELDNNKKETEDKVEEERKLNKERSKVDKTIDQLTKEISDLLAEETRRKETIKRHETDITKSEVEKEKEEKKKTALEAAPEKAERKIAKWREEVEQLTEIENTANTEADNKLEEFEKRSEKLKEEKKKVAETCSKSGNEFNAARSEATVARDEYEDMKKSSTSGTRKLDELKEKLESVKEKYNKDKEELEKLKPNLNSLNEKSKDISEKLPRVRNKAREINTAYSNSKCRLDALKEQNASSESNPVMQALMKEKQEGRIPSVIGRVGDLAVIDKKYEVALCTNYRFNLNLIAVGTKDDGKKIINLINAKKWPRHHLQLLDQLSPVKPESLMPAPAGKYPGPRLIDLIDCEPEIKKVYFSFLANAIVANNTAEAMRWNQLPECRGVTICTLQGDMVFSNGTITGGGRQVAGLILTDKNKRRKQVSAEDRAEERELVVKVDQLLRKSDELRDEEHTLDKQLIEVRHQINDLTRRISIVTAAVQANEPVLEALERTVGTQEKEASRVNVDAKDLEAKQKIVEDLEKKRDELSEKAEKSKKRQDEIESKLDEMFKELVECHRDEAKNALHKRQKLEKDIAREAASVTNSARNIAKCDENIARFIKDIEKKRRLCDELLEKAVDEKAVETKKSTLEELENTRKTLEAQFEELTKKQSELSDAETKLEVQLQTCKDEVAELKESMMADKMRVKDLDKKLAGLKINRIPRFQFLVQSSRPEDLAMQIDDPQVDENQSPEETEKQKKHMACVMSDRAYALEFELRRKVLENTESYEDVDGDKLVPAELLTAEQVAEISDRDAEELRFKLKNCEQQLEILKTQVDISSIDAYVIKVKQYNEQVIKLTLVTEDHRKHNTRLQALKKERLEEFHAAFEFIGKHLVAVFKMLTDGGDAKLEYIDKDDPFKEGISFMVRPAKKAWKQIQNLSGGEKTLSSLALIFALHMFRPTPFYVMDEIDAALDYRNVSIIAQYIRQKTENAQFIIISLRNNMFELANRLVGIYKVDDCTKNVAIDPLKVCEMAKSVSTSLGQITCTLPDEVTRSFNETRNKHHQEITAQEKQYPNFPSSSEISKAEKIVTVEQRVRNELNNTTRDMTSPRPQSKTKNATEQQNINRSESRVNQMKIPIPRLVEPASSLPARTSRKERNTEADETTPPTKAKRTTRSPTKATSGRTRRNDNPVESEDDDME